MSHEYTETLTKNLAKVEELSSRLMNAIAGARGHDPALDSPDHTVLTDAWQGYMAAMAQNPAKIVGAQMAFWSKSVTHFIEAQQQLARGELRAPDDTGPKDRRFANPMWDTHPYFNYVKRQYQINRDAIEEALDQVQDLNPKEKRRLGYFTRQIVDMMSPANFLATNPDALERAIETEGQSLVDGLENLVRDLEANNGEMLVRLVDEGAFEVGGNIATTEGAVIHRNKMMELIQYAPTTEKVHATPLIIFPPWINKYYILDLKAQNSLIKWLVDQGYTVFIVSWVNADPDYRDVGLEDYIEQGYLEAFDVVKKVTGQKKVNAVGYCIAGTALSLTLSLMKQRGDKSVKSATFFTTLTDFSDQGEFTPFLYDDFVDGIENEVEDKGVLPSVTMARTFSFLRSNDLIYQPAVKSYLMGETPPAFDLLYWNGDGANLPGRMAMEYLRGLCQRNELAEGGFPAFGTKLKLEEVDVPLCAIAAETDHIAAWRDSYRGVRQMGSKSKVFILGESGHIAGIVNPPSKDKYGYYINDNLDLDQDEWQAQADYHKGSWWPHWEKWLGKHAGKKTDARTVGTKDYPALCPAPGEYVRKKARDLV